MGIAGAALDSPIAIPIGAFVGLGVTFLVWANSESKHRWKEEEWPKVEAAWRNSYVCLTCGECQKATVPSAA